MDDCKCFSCPLSDCVSPCPFGVVDEVDTDEYILDPTVYKKRQKRRAYCEKYKEYMRAYYKAYREENKEKINAYKKAYYQALKARNKHDLKEGEKMKKANIISENVLKKNINC